MNNDAILEKIQNQIPNFRDLAEFNQSYIKPNMIYRSSSPIFYQSLELLEDFRSLGIRNIMDLRSVIEIGNSSYDDFFISEIKYNWIHLDISFPPYIMAEKGLTHLSLYKQFCWYTLFYNKVQIRKIFTLLADDLSYRIIIHCHAGRDRTGIISSLILLLMRAPVVNIIQDYLATDTLTQSEDIEYILKMVEEVGGINAYLNDCGIDGAVQQKIRQYLQP